MSQFLNYFVEKVLQYSDQYQTRISKLEKELEKSKLQTKAYENYVEFHPINNCMNPECGAWEINNIGPHEGSTPMEGCYFCGEYSCKNCSKSSTYSIQECQSCGVNICVKCVYETYNSNTGRCDSCE